MKKRGKKVSLNKETLSRLGANDLGRVRGGASGTYCADCGSGTACPQLKF
jgi:hypothetical protein